MRSLIESIFGVYTPVTYAVTSGEVESFVVPDGLAGVDWPYVLGILLFALVLWCVLRIFGGLICKGGIQ